MQRGIIWIRGYQGAKFGLSFMEFLRARVGCGSKKRGRNGRANLRRLNIARAENSHQLFARPRGLDLAQLPVRGQSR
jgi:hypothetical protein